MLHDAVRFVILANLAYFFLEFSVALAIRSVSLFADGIDFLEDASVNALILLALNWSAKARARVGFGMAALLLLPGIAAVWTAWQNFAAQIVPAPIPLSVTGIGAFVVNFACAAALARFRDHAGSLTKAAFLSARNDVFANVAIVAAGVATAFSYSPWPDLIVGVGIVILNTGSAREIVEAAREEHEAPPS